MHIDWKKTATVGLNLLSIIVPAIGQVETLAKAIPGMKGAQKEDAVVITVKDLLEGGESTVGKELANDTAVENATRDFIRAYVGVQNAVAASKAVVQTPPDPNQSVSQ